MQTNPIYTQIRFTEALSAGLTVGKDFNEGSHKNVGSGNHGLDIGTEGLGHIFVNMKTTIAYNTKLENFTIRQFDEHGLYSEKELYFFKYLFLPSMRSKIEDGGLKFDFFSSFSNSVQLHGTDYGDFLKGASFNDTFKANGGNDKIYGEAGDDYIYGGAGSDSIFGGVGTDTLDYQFHTSVTVDLKYGYTEKTNGERDTFSSIENVVGSKFSDTLFGNDLDNFIRGVGGADTIDGRGGDDRIVVTETPVMVSGGSGSDDLLISNFSKYVFTDANFKNIEAVYIQNASSLDMSDVSKGVKIVAKNNEWSRISIVGTEGDDTIYTGDGRDIIDGGAGNDRLISGSASDVFKFKDEFGIDRIVNFNAKKDYLDLSDVASDMSDIEISEVHDGEGTMITINSLDSDLNRIVLHDTDISTLSARNFLFDAL